MKYGWEWNHVRAIEEWDEREWVRVRNGMRELRGRMLACWDLLRKNSDQLLKQTSFSTQLT